LIPSSFSDGLGRATPRSVGIDSGAVMAFLDDVEAAGLELHDIMVWRDGAIVAEGWHWPYRADRLRISHSMTKSVTACAIGILVDEHRITLSDKVVGFFPEAAIDPASATARMTVEDLLTMRAGHGAEVSGAIWRGITTSWIDEFFRISIVHEPGTVHVYTSAASYMLSAIVTRVTGETIDDFLRPRLFEPLGMTVRWDMGPDGVNPGGNGINWTTADGLKLGILHAQRGLWNGQRILSESWVTEATRAHVEQYGYHWVARDGFFAALGVFVQMVLVFPDSNVVIALNSAMKESAVLLPHIRRHFPGAFAGAADAEADAALAARLDGWAAEPAFHSNVQGDPVALAGQWAVDANDHDVCALTFDFTGGEVSFAIHDAEGEHRVVAPLDGWAEAPGHMPAADLHHGYRMEGMSTVAGARWIGPSEFELVLHFTESAFRDTIVFTIEGERLTMERRVNINSGARAWPTMTAKRTA
jgi:CubicO group peptidase (beta-lactamase class C family)